VKKIENWEERITINPDALDVEFLGQAELMLNICQETAIAKEKLNYAKEKLDVEKAKAANRARGELDKPTVAAVDQFITLDKEVLDQQEKLRRAQFEYDLLSGAVKAVDQRKTALENLVRLHGQQYFAGPSVPRNLSEEVIDRTRRDRDKAKMRQRRENRRK